MLGGVRSCGNVHNGRGVGDVASHCRKVVVVFSFLCLLWGCLFVCCFVFLVEVAGERKREF